MGRHPLASASEYFKNINNSSNINKYIVATSLMHDKRKEDAYLKCWLVKELRELR